MRAGEGEGGVSAVVGAGDAGEGGLLGAGDAVRELRADAVVGLAHGTLLTEAEMSAG